MAEDPTDEREEDQSEEGSYYEDAIDDMLNEVVSGDEDGEG